MATADGDTGAALRPYTPANGPALLTLLPEDVLVETLCPHLHPRDVLALYHTCRAWRAMVVSYAGMRLRLHVYRCVHDVVVRSWINGTHDIVGVLCETEKVTRNRSRLSAFHDSGGDAAGPEGNPYGEDAGALESDLDQDDTQVIPLPSVGLWRDVCPRIDGDDVYFISGACKLVKVSAGSLERIWQVDLCNPSFDWVVRCRSLGSDIANTCAYYGGLCPVKNTKHIIVLPQSRLRWLYLATNRGICAFCKESGSAGPFFQPRRTKSVKFIQIKQVIPLMSRRPTSEVGSEWVSQWRRIRHGSGGNPLARCRICRRMCSSGDSYVCSWCAGEDISLCGECFSDTGTEPGWRHSHDGITIAVLCSDGVISIHDSSLTTLHTIAKFKGHPVKVLSIDHGIGHAFIILLEVGQTVNELYCYGCDGSLKWTSTLSDFRVASTSPPWVYMSSKTIVFKEVASQPQMTKSVMFDVLTGEILYRGDKGNIVPMQQIPGDIGAEGFGFALSQGETVEIMDVYPRPGVSVVQYQPRLSLPAPIILTMCSAGDFTAFLVVQRDSCVFPLEVACIRRHDSSPGVEWSVEIEPEADWQKVDKDSNLTISCRQALNEVYVHATVSVGDRLTILDASTGAIKLSAYSPRRDS